MLEFHYILILLSCAVILVTLCKKFNLPPIIGYLCTGIIIGPFSSPIHMHDLAEFGIVFLMFTLGLEFSITRVLAAKRVLLGVGGLQVFLCTLSITIIGIIFHLNIKESFIIGCAFSLSSTAVVVKQLIEKKSLNSKHGNLSINILLFQDLAAVLFLIIIEAISNNNSSLHEAFLFTMLKGISVVISMALIGFLILRPLFHEIAKSHSAELFMMATLLVALTAAGITQYLELSLALGAFLSGMMLQGLFCSYCLERCCFVSTLLSIAS